MKINHLSQEELGALLEQVKERSVSLRKERLDSLRKRLLAEVAAEGFTVSEVFSPAKAISKKPSGKPAKAMKFRDPTDPSRTWSGHGRSPQWYRDVIASGKSPQTMLIVAAKGATQMEDEAKGSTAKAAMKPKPVAGKKRKKVVPAKKTAPAKKAVPAKKAIASKKAKAAPAKAQKKESAPATASS